MWWSHGQERRLVDRAIIFSDLLIRQQLRREAQLPTLDLRAEYDRAVQHRLWREHVEQRRGAIRAEVLRVEREKHGPTYPQSAGGRWAVNAKVNMALTESFQAR